MAEAVAFRERPILFSGPMVRAILDGRKTQTRRIVKLPSGATHAEVELARMQAGYPEGVRPVWDHDGEPNAFSTRNPYGQPGDRLWVRETWHCPMGLGGRWIREKLLYRADEPYNPPKWRSPIFMPRWASRLTLEITDIRVERLQDISRQDVYAEGVGPGLTDHTDIAREWYCRAWDRINAKRASWDSNPWVWVLTFRRVEAAA